MGLFRNGKPSVKALARGADVAGLVEAARFRNLIPGPDGGTADLGAPVREEAILSLGALGSPAAMKVVEAALADPADRVRVAAVRVLRARQAAVPLAAALSRLPPGRGQSRRLALRALGELGRPESAAPLAAAILCTPGDAPVADEEGAVLTRLVAAADPDATGNVVDQLLHGLADERDAVADRAEDLLVLIAPAGLRGLIAELEAGAGAHRAAAALGRIRDTEALGSLMDGLLHRDPRVRAECATALGELRDPAAVEALIHATRDSEHRVRAQAGWALDRLGTVAVVVGVSTLVRPMIHEALGAPQARRALEPAPADEPDDGPVVDEPEMPLVLEPSLADFDDGVEARAS